MHRDDQQKLDEKFMMRALELAQQNLGYTSPNPSVAAVIVKDKKIISEGVTQPNHGNHAEVEAINKCEPEGTTLYTTLEPCEPHEGKFNPACTQKIIDAKIKRVVIATTDKNPKISGKGINVLKKAGILVSVGLLENDAQKLHEFFFKWITTKKPFVTIKAALTADGNITWGDGVRKKITGDESRRAVHIMRRQYDAILIGVNTLLKDNPQLTTRLVPGTNPMRVILDSTLKTPLDANIFKNEGRVLLFCTNDAAKEKMTELEKKCEVVVSPKKEDLIDIDFVLETLGKKGITSVIVEGGKRVLASFLNQNKVDKGVFFVAEFLKQDGQGFFSLLSKKALRLRNISAYTHGKDIMLEGYL